MTTSSPVPPEKTRPAPPTLAAAQIGAAPAVAAAPEAGPGRRKAAFGPVGPRIGRIPVVDVSPVVEAGRWPAKAAVGEAVPVRATVFREGHDAVGATAVLVGPDGVDRSSARMVDVGAKPVTRRSATAKIDSV